MPITVAISQQERESFISYLEQEARNNEGLVEQSGGILDAETIRRWKSEAEACAVVAKMLRTADVEAWR